MPTHTHWYLFIVIGARKYTMAERAWMARKNLSRESNMQLLYNLTICWTAKASFIDNRRAIIGEIDELQLLRAILMIRH